MELEEIRNYCLSKTGTSENLPFDNKTLVFKVGGKMFALLDLEKKNGINLKCDPEKAIELRENYNFVLPGYHMNKKHWNTIEFNSELNVKQLQGWIDDSYNLIVSKLSKKEKLLIK